MSKIQIGKGLIFLAAFISFLLSVYLWFGGSREQGLFGSNIFNTLLVGGTVGLLVWAAIEDGRRNREAKERQSKRDAPPSSDPKDGQ